MYLDLTLPQVCGQLIVGGFAGQELAPPFADALSRGQRGGAILFSRNLPTLAQGQALCRAIVDAAPAELPPLIGVDEEGGQVTRLPKPAPRLPSMRRLGAVADAPLVERAGRAVAEQLRELGFNVDFAPVLDVDSNSANPVIGDRSFSSDPAVVAALGQAFAAGLQAGGVMACGKHFPGHGDTSQDSHLDLPHVAHERARLDSIEIHPFRQAARAGLASIMTAHVVYSALDPGVPATLSRRICTQLLRTELGFEGVLFTDGMEMRALADRLAIEQSAVRAIEAGCDVLLICHDLDLQERAHAALLAKAEADETFRQRCVQAAERGLRARRRFVPRPLPSLSATHGDSLRAVVEQIATRG